MFKRILVLFCYLIIVIFALAACNLPQAIPESKDYLTEKTVFQLCQHRYAQDQLNKILSFRGSVAELELEYPIECIRENGELKRATFLGENEVVFVYVDSSNNILSSWRYEITNDSTAFEQVSIGQPLEEVMKIDPDASYLFLFTGTNDAPHVSVHCTTDGYLISISYDAENLVSDISVELL